MSECIHGLDADWCATCKHGPETPVSDTVEATFRAKFPGDCPGCNLPIHEGQTIHKMSSGRYVHESCA